MSSSSDDSSKGLLGRDAQRSGGGDEREMEGLPLVGHHGSPWFESKRALLANFFLMSAAFAINHGCVTALLSLASADLGKHLGSQSSGTLYVFYTLSALTVAASLVRRTGSKWALAGGLWLYCFYVGSFLVAYEKPHYKTPAAITGSVLGGFAAGWLWTAQGAFFSRTAQLYARASGRPLAETNGYLGGFFATLYVGGEVTMKGLSSLLHELGGTSTVFAIFLVAAVTSAFTMTFVRALPSQVEQWRSVAERSPADEAARGELDMAMADARQQTHAPWYAKLTLAMRLLATDRKMQLLAPLNMAFGFVAALVNQWVNGDPAKAAVGANNIGYLAAVTPAVATLLSGPYAYLSRNGKGPAMIFGALNYTVMALVIMVMTTRQLGDLGWGIVFIYVIGGSGRAVFESTNKAVFADAWPNDKEAAFANVIVLSGGASAVAFFAIPYMSKIETTSITAATGLLAIVCLVVFFRILRQQEADEAQEKLRSDARAQLTSSGGAASYQAPPGARKGAE